MVQLQTISQHLSPHKPIGNKINLHKAKNKRRATIAADEISQQGLPTTHEDVGGEKEVATDEVNKDTSRGDIASNYPDDEDNFESNKSQTANTNINKKAY